MSRRVSAKVTLNVEVEVDVTDDADDAVGAVLGELIDHVDAWEPDIDGPHPDAVAWPTGGSACAIRSVSLSMGASL